MAPRVIFENQTPLGKAVQQETLDTNRPSIKQESTDRFANAIALNSRGIWVNVTQWATYTAGLVAAMELAYIAGLPSLAASTILAICAALLIGTVISTVDRRKSLRFDGFVRLLFFIAGLVIALL